MVQEGDEAPESEGEGRRLRGFAAMTPERRREVARLGGRLRQLAGNPVQFQKGDPKTAEYSRRGVAAKAAKKIRISEVANV